MKPFKVELKLSVNVDPADFDDDVDWSNPEKVIQEVIDSEGWRALDSMKDLNNFEVIGFGLTGMKK